MMNRLSAKVLAIAILIGLVGLLLFGGLRACQKLRSVEAQSKVDTAQGGAFKNSAVDAINTQSGVNERERESEGLTRTNEKEIRDAEGAGDRVNPGVRDAGLRAICRRPAYRDSEQCRVFRAPPPGVEGGR